MLTIDQLPAGTPAYTDVAPFRDLSETTVQQYTKKMTLSQLLNLITFATPVEEYGAVGNGTTDDTAAIQAAVNAVGPGGCVVLGYGKTYKTTAAITFNSDYVTVIAYGATITSENASQHIKFSILNRTGVKVTGGKYSCLYSTVAGAGQATIDIDMSSEITVKDVEINDTPLGVRISGDSHRCVVDGGKFYKNFLAVLVDDGATINPTGARITNNHIRTGLGGPGTALSGGIKMSGALPGTLNSSCGHVVSGNNIVSPGEVGIEMQSRINDCSVSANTIIGAGYGISIADCRSVAVAGNAVNACTLYGIELVQSVACNASGNVVNGKNASGTLVGNVGIIMNQCQYCTCTGGAVRGILGGSLIAVDSAYVSFGGGIEIENQGNTAIEITHTTDFSFTGIGINSIGAAVHFIVIDATGLTCERGIISQIRFSGSTSQTGIVFNTPTGGIGVQYVTISNNTVYGASSASDLLANGPSGAGFVRRLRVFDNITVGPANVTTALELPPYSITSDITMHYRLPNLQIDATSNPIVVTLDDPTNLQGVRKTAIRTDNTPANSVTFTTPAGIIFGTYNLNAQGKYVTFQSDGGNWLVISAN